MINSTKINLDQKIKYLIIFSPVILIVLQSYFKQTLIGYSSILGFTCWPEGFYWILRTFLVSIFIISIFKLTPLEIIRPEKYVDIYAKEKAMRDPLMGLRALACMNVFFGHWFMVVFGPNIPAHTQIDQTLRIALSFSPWAGVWIFFTISGYLMGKGFVTGRHSIDKGGLKKFYSNRILRIFPIYFFSIFLVATLVSPSNLDIRNSGTWNDIFSSLLFDQQGGGAIGALWSVSTEFSFYLLAPFLFLIISVLFKKARGLLFFMLVLCAIFGAIKFWILSNFPELWHTRIYMPLLLNLDCFISGMVTSFLVKDRLSDNKHIPHGLKIGIFVTLFFQSILSAWSFHEMASYDGIPGSSTRFYFLSYAPGLVALMSCLIIYIF